MNVKEDNISLFGFLTQQEQDIFYQLIGVSGIGPKGALAFLSNMTPQEIILAILSEDSKELSKVPGIGKKTAQRIVLELKDKVKVETQLEQPLEVAQEIEKNEKWEAIEALTALGYRKQEGACRHKYNAENKDGQGVHHQLCRNPPAVHRNLIGAPQSGKRRC